MGFFCFSFIANFFSLGYLNVIGTMGTFSMLVISSAAMSNTMALELTYSLGFVAMIHYKNNS